MAAKMDFLSWQKETAASAGLKPEELGTYRDVAILTFADNGYGVLTARHKVLTTFIDPSSKAGVVAGETWVCSIFSEASKGRYIATPLSRVDLKFLYGSLEGWQKEEMASIVWNNERAALEPVLEQRYRAKIEEKAAADATASAKAEIDSLNADIVALTAENARLRQENLRARSSAFAATVTREGPETISSDFITAGRYSVHLNTDHTVMEIMKNEGGQLVSDGGRLELRGLGLVSPFTGPCEMATEYIPQRGALQVRLA